jgi:uncharacterized protein (DUF849 family)
MKRSNKVIITCAVTGSIHTPTMSPHLPITPDEIAEQAIAAAEAGAAMLHPTSPQRRRKIPQAAAPGVLDVRVAVSGCLHPEGPAR